MELAADAGMPQVRAVAGLRLERRVSALARAAAGDDATAAHVALLARDVDRFLARSGPAYSAPVAPAAPPGAPIGQPPLEWRWDFGETCTWDGR
jgi:hypothetical protein